jgi:hypothetical protein
MSRHSILFNSLFVGSVLAGCTGTSDPCDSAKAGDACLWAGTGVQGYNGENEKLPRLQSWLDRPTAVAFSPDGQGYIDDWNNHMIRQVQANGDLIRVVGTTYEGDGDPNMNDRLPVCNPVGAIGNTVAMNHPTHIVFGPDGALWIAAWHNNKIRRFDPATGIVKTFAGDFYGFTGDGGPACNATFNQESSLVFGPDGTLYASDQRNVRIRMIAAGSATSVDYNSVISTIAGTGVEGSIGDGGPAIQAEFGWVPSDTPPVSGWLAMDPTTPTLLYIADSKNNRIRVMHLDTGIVECIAGQSMTASYTGDGGPALTATFNWPLGIEIGPDHNLYVADELNNVVRKIEISDGVVGNVTTVVGNGNACMTSNGPCPDRALATDLELYAPYSVAFDPAGDMYVADTQNNRIMRVLMP